MMSQPPRSDGSSASQVDVAPEVHVLARGDDRVARAARARAAPRRGARTPPERGGHMLRMRARAWMSPYTPPPAACVMRSSRAPAGAPSSARSAAFAEVGDERLDHVHARAAPRADAPRERRAQLRRRQRGVRRGREAHRAVGRVEERARRRERVHDVEVDVAVGKHEPLEQGAGLQPFGHARHAHGDLRAVQMAARRRGAPRPSWPSPRQQHRRVRILKNGD